MSDSSIEVGFAGMAADRQTAEVIRSVNDATPRQYYHCRQYRGHHSRLLEVGIPDGLLGRLSPRIPPRIPGAEGRNPSLKGSQRGSGRARDVGRKRASIYPNSTDTHSPPSRMGTADLTHRRSGQ